MAGDFEADDASTLRSVQSGDDEGAQLVYNTWSITQVVLAKKLDSFRIREAVTGRGTLPRMRFGCTARPWRGGLFRGGACPALGR